MIILRSILLDQFPEIIFGFSTKIGLNRKLPYYFNVSLSVGENDELVQENRKKFFAKIGLDIESFAYQKQTHGDEINYAAESGYQGESDALITDKKGIALTISTADCPAIFIYDRKKKIIAAVHSGWRSTSKKILMKTLLRMTNDFSSAPGDLAVYIGPSISQKNYEVGPEVASLFDNKFLIENESKYLLDVAGVNYNMLLHFGVLARMIQHSNLCTYETANLLHSYRRDGQNSGRSFGVIAIRNNT